MSGFDFGSIDTNTPEIGDVISNGDKPKAEATAAPKEKQPKPKPSKVVKPAQTEAPRTAKVMIYVTEADKQAIITARGDVSESKFLYKAVKAFIEGLS